MNPPPSPSFLRRLIQIDTAVSLHLHNSAQPYLPRSILKALEISGDGRLFFPIAISLYLSPLISPNLSLLCLHTFLADLLIGAVADLLVIGLIKHLVRRPRPIYNKHMSIAFAVDHWSFPSGHSSRVCFIAALFYLSCPKINDLLVQLESLGTELFVLKEGNVVIYFVGVWAIGTSVSRVLLGRHYVFDVIVGACLGVLEAFFVFNYLNYSTFSSILSWTKCKYFGSRFCDCYCKMCNFSTRYCCKFVFFSRIIWTVLKNFVFWVFTFMVSHSVGFLSCFMLIYVTYKYIL